VEPLIPWSWGGGVSTLFAYGQTGSGKTYTVSELQRLAARDLMDGVLPGSREINLSAFELAGNAAFGTL
jgi:kinesin family protein 2/24